MKERRSYPRILMGEHVEFGIDSSIYHGTSYVFSPDGMSILADKILPAKSNIVIKIHSKVGGIITIEGEVIWEQTLSEKLSIMGVNFNNPSEELCRIYEAKRLS